MINWLHSVLHDPRLGWDPIPARHAADYAQSAPPDYRVVDLFEEAIDGYKDKRIVDLGSGPGQYASEFARRGACVTCIDVSARYLALVEQRMKSAGLSATLVLGYMDHVTQLTEGGFDAAFSSVSWRYCMNDLRFARKILAALRPGGLALVRTSTESVERHESVLRHVSYLLNERFYLKFGHPLPPPGRVAFAFRRLGGCDLHADYSDHCNDFVLIRKRLA